MERVYALAIGLVGASFIFVFAPWVGRFYGPSYERLLGPRMGLAIVVAVVWAIRLLGIAVIGGAIVEFIDPRIYD